MTEPGGPTIAESPRPAGRLSRLASALRPSSLAAAVPGPLFHKEVRISGRKAATYWFRGLYGAGLLALVSLMFLGEYHPNAQGSPSALSLQQLQMVAPQITLTVVWFQFIVLCLVSAVLTAPSICDERRAGTLGTLLSTPLKAWQITLGKVTAQCVQLIILSLVPAPLLLAIRVFGGVPGEIVIASMSLSLSTALLAAVLGVFCSTTVKRATGAIVSSLVLLAGIQFLVPLVFAILSARGVRLDPNLLTMASTPIALGMVCIDLFSGAGAGGVDTTRAWMSSTVFTLIAALVMFVAATWQVRRVMSREGEGHRLSSAPKRKGGKKAATPAPEAEAAPAPASTDGQPEVPGLKKRRRPVVERGQSRTVGDSPVLWRELRQSTFRRPLHMWVAVLCAATLMGYVYYEAGLDEHTLQYPVAMIAMVLAVLIAMVSSTSVIAGERESRTLDVLLTTPLSARAIIAGKFWGALRRQWFVPALLTAHLAFTSLPFGSISIIALPHLLALMAGPIIFLTATGTFFSVFFRKSVASTTINMGLGIAIWAALPAIVAILQEAFGLLDRGSQTLLSLIAIINPMPMTFVAVRGARDTTWLTGSDTYELFDFQQCNAVEFSLVVAAYLIGYSLLAYMVLRMASAILAHRSGRAR